ncbi:MAG TPA: hypothetical protein VFS44_09120 [Gemmatimonadaceae bacterium]|nr:hypothetical protein [Gemmatimonadaceae bacterium]
MRHPTRRVRNACRSIAVMLAGSALALAASDAPAAAQTRFAWPDTTVQVSTYATVDLCLAAVQRVERGVQRHEALTLWRDTVPRDPRERSKPLPAPVAEAATRCVARFPEATAKLDDYAPLLALYLMAGRDADASALVARRVAAVPAKDTKERKAVQDTAVESYLRARPARLDAAEQILVSRAHGGSADRMDRMQIYAKLMTEAKGAGDTARSRRAARWIVAVADSLTPEERESDKYQEMGGGGGGRLVVFAAVQELLGLQVMLDSLRHGTAALVSLERNMWAEWLRERPEALPLPIGEHAPTIAADYWLPSAAGSTPRPTPGHVSYLVFVDGVDCVQMDPLGDIRDGCGPTLATLRRMSERFPTLDVTLVSGTHGHFVYAPPMTPAEEAEMLRKWLEPYHIPRLTVAVTSTPYWNLPRPDGRRIDKPTANYTSYTFGKSVKPLSNAYLIDQDGIVITALGMGESDLAQFIDVLVHRQVQGGEHAAK